MTVINNLIDQRDEPIDLNINDSIDTTIDGQKLLVLPAGIDPHVHFRTPGHEYKENWQTGAQAAIHGGITQVFDMPNNQPAIIDKATLKQKKEIIDKQLTKIDIPLKYHLYFGATSENISELKKVKNDIVAIKLFMGSSTGNLLVDRLADQEKIFKTAHELDLVVAVHAEDELIMKAEADKYSNSKDPKVHSQIRNRKAAAKAVQQAIDLTSKYQTKLYILHLSTAEEVELVKQAKKNGLPVFAETTPHHLFLTTAAYEKWGTKVQMNPPLREPSDINALWQGINEGIIDTIGTDHAPHTLDEKILPYGEAPSGIPGVETRLPLLLNAYHNQKISLEKIIDLTRKNIEKIFSLPQNNDKIIVDLNLVKKVNDADLKTKCGWSPFSGMTLTGWPIYTILNNTIYKLNN